MAGQWDTVVGEVLRCAVNQTLVYYDPSVLSNVLVHVYFLSVI